MKIEFQKISFNNKNKFHRNKIKIEKRRGIKNRNKIKREKKEEIKIKYIKTGNKNDFKIFQKNVDSFRK